MTAPLNMRRVLRWVFALLGIAGGLTLFLTGLASFEMWFVVIAGYYLFWCLKLD